MPNSCEELRERAKRFLAGQHLTFEEATERVCLFWDDG